MRYQNAYADKRNVMVIVAFGLLLDDWLLYPLKYDLSVDGQSLLIDAGVYVP